MSLTIILDSTLESLFDKTQSDNLTEKYKKNLPVDKDWSEWQNNKDKSSDLYLEQTRNGLVNAFLTSYNNHLPLLLTPDVLHITIQQVIATFVNNNAEKLRHLFVEHEGQRNLLVESETRSFGEFSLLMSQLLRKNVKDPEFLEAITTQYSTTTQTSSYVSSMLMMNTLKEYFTYTFMTRCGIPSVILEGSQDDWILLKKKYTYLKNMLMGTANKELDCWFKVMDSIVDLFLNMRFLGVSGTVNATDSQKAIFKNIISNKLPNGSGSQRQIGGWINILSPYTNKNRILDFSNGYGYRNYTELQNSMYETPVQYIVSCVSYSTLVRTGFSYYSHIDPVTNIVSPVLEYSVMQEIKHPIHVHA